MASGHWRTPSSGWARFDARPLGLTSAGVLVYRRQGERIELLLGHPGGPLWARKDLGAWMIPKGLIEAGEEPLAAALREFEEETGLKPPPISHPLTPLRQAGGKTVLCWAAESDLDLAAFRPGTFEMEWPRPGRESARRFQRSTELLISKYGNPLPGFCHPKRR
jgi:predicted NUDIX family NTP pyrophosphohydrolase